MSGRIFQNVVLQLKENTDQTVGVIDGEGVVIACSELSMIGQRWSEYVAAVNGAAGSMVCFDGKTFKALSGWGNQFDYAVFAFGDNEISKTICSMATVALNAAKSYYEEKHDRGSFVKDIISDNIMLGDIYMRAKELRVATDVSRGIFAIRALQKGESVPTETIQAMFPDRQNDFVLSVGEGDVVLIRQLPDGAGSKELNKTAAQIEEALRVNGESTVVVGMGTIAMHLRDLAKSYKEAQIAMEVSKVFDTEKQIIRYDNLGIARLIYQLPTNVSEMFQREEFKQGSVLDQYFNLDIAQKFAGMNIYSRPKCQKCWAKFYCSGGCAANAFHATGSIRGVYEAGCELFRKRIECAIMMKVAEDSAKANG